jgi:hypothetical protein
VAQSVLGLALVEGALAVCVKHARELALPAFAAAKFDLDPKKWQVEDLLACAAAGNDSALLDPAAKYHAEGLLLTRQRLHAGWMLSEYPEGFSDHDFSDGSDPKATVDQVVGRAVAWLRKNPPGTSAPPIWRGELGANHVFAPEPSWLPSQSNLRAGKMA